MSPAPTLRIRYALGFAIALVVLGPLLLVLASLTANVMNALVGAMNLGLGIAMMVNPFIVVTGGELRLKNLLGMTLRRLPAVGDDGAPRGFTLSEDGKRIIWQDPDGKARTLKISRFSARNEDFDAFAAWVKTGVFG
jgi:hypothetical protein